MTGRVSMTAAITAACLIAQIPGAVDPQMDSAGFHWFRLGESKPEVARLLGAPKLVSPFGSDFEGWQFQIGETEEGEFSHHAVFRKADGKLVSMARDYTEPTNVDAWFPAAETVTCMGPSEWSVRARTLGQGRYLLAMGVAKAGDKTTQIVLIDESALRVFYPWLYEKIIAANK